ncbi:MAG: hypothetical protein E7583_02380 [Ruminococcaceae bacterium]|nr:hypothetical protein [Oscillospiraceae bacterium]
MERKVFKNAMIGGVITDIEVIDGKFGMIGKLDEEGVDLSELDVFPGLIDLHCHGALGNDAYYGFDKLSEMSIFMVKNGVTCWYPTIGSIPWDRFEKALEENYEGLPGACIPGFHLEGPYIAGGALGSGSGSNIKTPKIQRIPHLEKVRLINVAPEVDGVLDFIKENPQIRFALGHTNADYELCIKAIEAGANSLTHIFNAMPGLHHREPGPIGAAIDKDMYVQLICDGIHIHKSVVKAVYRIFGKERVILISDAVCGLGLPDGEHIIHGNVKRIIKDGAIRTETGKLAGSASTLFRDVQKAIEFGIPREDAFRMASATPAEYMGINKGKIETGYDADFIVVDKDNKLVGSYVAGENYL